MKKKIIVGRNNQEYYYLIVTKVNDEWVIKDRKKKNVEKSIENLLNNDINDLQTFENSLIVKTNDDLVAVVNYYQISHDKVFNSFNRKVEEFTTNKELLRKKTALQRQSNHKKAVIGRRVLATAVIAGMLIITSSEHLGALGIAKINTIKASFEQTSQKTPADDSVVAIEKDTVGKKPIEQNVVTDAEVPVDKVKNTEEELLNNTIREYANMYGIDYKRALTLVKENASAIKSEYATQEAGIIRTLAKEHYDDPNISKTPEVSNMSSIEREKLLLRFAKAHGIEDTETAATLLAVYRLETGNGQSEACVNSNNFGGLRNRNSQTGRYYVMEFKTPEIGAEAMVYSFLNIKNRTVYSQHYNPSRSLEQNMNRIYCREQSWPNKVLELKQEVLNEHDLNNHVNQEEPKQLIK